MRLIEYKKEVIGMRLQELSRVVEDRTLDINSFRGTSKVRTDSMACNKKKINFAINVVPTLHTFC